MEKGEKAVKVNLLFNKASAVSPILNVAFMIDRPHVAKDIVVVFVCIQALIVRYDRVHSELRVLVVFNEVGSHRRCHHVRHIGISLG